MHNELKNYKQCNKIPFDELAYDPNSLALQITLDLLKSSYK